MAGTSIGTLKAFLLLDTAGWTGGFASAGKAAKGFAGGIGATVMGNLKGIGLAAIGAGAGLLTAGVGFNGLFESLGRVGHLSGTAKKLGLSVEQTQKLGMAAEHTGVDLDTLAKYMFIMGKNIGSGGMSMDKRFLQVADSIMAIKDPAERGAMAMKIFGKGGYEVIGLLSKGSEGIMRSADAVDRFGLAIKDVDAAKAKEAMLSLMELKAVLTGIKDKIAIELAPTVTSFTNTWLDGIELLINKWDELSGAMGESENTFMDYLSTMLANPLMTILNPSSFFGDNADALQGLIEMRKDSERNRKQKSASGGIGDLNLKGGGVGGGHEKQAAVEMGSVAAASAIASMQEDPTAAKLDKLLIVMQEVARNTRRQLGSGGGMAVASL